jgi:hypothetical protein
VKKVDDMKKLAEIRLSLLRENFDYIDFFNTYRDIIDHEICNYNKNSGLSRKVIASFKKYGVHITHAILFTAPFAPGGSKFLLNILDPEEKLPIDPFKKTGLHNMFFQSTIEKIPFLKDIEGRSAFWIYHGHKLSQVQNEVANFYPKLSQKRQRDEVQGQLRVWEHRRKRKSFSLIAKYEGITEEAARKRFYKAYQLTQGTSYNKDKFILKGWNISKRGLCKDCDDHPDKGGTCTYLCPDALSYVRQDHRSRKEKFMSKKDIIKNI